MIAQDLIQLNIVRIGGGLLSILHALTLVFNHVVFIMSGMYGLSFFLSQFLI